MPVRVLRQKDPDDPASLTLVEEEAAQPGPGEVRLRFTSIGLNRADLLYPAKRYFNKPTRNTRLGFEGAGVIEACGDGVNRQIGEQVALCPMSFDVVTQGSLADTGIYREDQLLSSPKALDTTATGAIWMAYLTAWGGLIDAGHLEHGQTIVITAASSAVGLAAMQIARATDAQVVATTTSREKVAILKENGADAVLMQPRDEDEYPRYVEQIRGLTGGQGSDLVFDAVAGPASQALIRASKRGGNIVIHGLLDRRPMNVHAGVLMKRLLTLKGYTLDQSLNKPETRQAAIDWLLPRFESGELKVPIAATFRLADYDAAFEYLASNKQIGKIVVVP